MSTILKSTLETYLLDEDMDFEAVEHHEAQQVEERTNYPSGFFTSL